MASTVEDARGTRALAERGTGDAAAAEADQAHNPPSASPDDHGSAVIEIRTGFPLSTQFLLVLVKTEITIDERTLTLPWGTSSFLVDSGTHSVRVSHRWIGRRDAGPAGTTVEVVPGETVRLRYRPPWLVFLAGKLTVEGSIHGNQQTERLVFAQHPHTRGARRIGVLAVGAVFTLVAAGVGSGFGRWVTADGSGSEGWATTAAGGMSIALPRSFQVFDDPADYAEGLAAIGTSETDELAETIEQFPELFALVAVEPLPGGIGPRASVVVLRMPSANEPLDDTAERFIEDLEVGGSYEVTAERRTSVGTARYTAVRIDSGGHLPGYPDEQTVTYIIDGGSQLWVVTFSTLRDQYETLSPMFDRSIASLTLPAPGGRAR